MIKAEISEIENKKNRENQLKSCSSENNNIETTSSKTKKKRSRHKLPYQE